MNGVLKNTFHSSRVTDIRKIVSDDGEKIINLVGLQFYRTCWTRTVSKFYSDIGNLNFKLNTSILFVLDVVEPVYGETLPIKPIQESVYNHVVE